MRQEHRNEVRQRRVSTVRVRQGRRGLWRTASAGFAAVLALEEGQVGD